MDNHKNILVVSNMYPDKRYPFYGIFVKNFCVQLDMLHVNYKLAVMTKKNGFIKKLVGYILFYTTTFFQCLFGKYKLIYIHYASHSSLPVLLSSKIKKNRILVNVHGSDVYPAKKTHRMMNGMTKKIIEISEKVIVPSEYFKNVIVEKYSYPKEKIIVYPSGGIDKNLFYEYTSEQKEKVKKKYNLDEALIYIGFVGRIDKVKGWHIYINAAKKVLDDGYKCGFIMIGSGPDDDLVSKTINDLGLCDDIKRYPQQPQNVLPDYYNMFDVFVFPTMTDESLGLVAIEAMACGCPVIGSDYAAPGTYIKDEDNGMKFSKGDDSALAKCIENYLNFSTEKKLKMKLSARKTADEYDSNKIRDVLKQIFE